MKDSPNCNWLPSEYDVEILPAQKQHFDCSSINTQKTGVSLTYWPRTSKDAGRICVVVLLHLNILDLGIDISALGCRSCVDYCPELFIKQWNQQRMEGGGAAEESANRGTDWFWGQAASLPFTGLICDCMSVCSLRVSEHQGGGQIIFIIDNNQGRPSRSKLHIFICRGMWYF